MKLDFHVHTHYSIDSLTDPVQLAKKSKKLGIIPSITDHNTIDAHAKFRQLGAEIIPGEEIRTDRGDLIGLFLNENIPRKTPFADALDLIHGQGGIAYLPHMFDKSRHGVIPSKKETGNVDITEVFNARCPLESFNHHAESFADANKLLKAAGSDSHFLFEYGHTYNDLPDFDLSDPKALLRALRSVRIIGKKASVFVHGTTTFIAFGKKVVRRLNL